MSGPVQRVLVTGGAGFVGASLVRQLVAQGREVAVLLRPTSDARRLQPWLDSLTVIRGDLSRLDDAEAAIRSFRPDAVAHLAWDGVKGADRNSDIQLANVGASIRLFELTRDAGCRRFCGLGSQAEYGASPGRLSEQSPTRPTTLYGAAKLGTGLMLERSAAAHGSTFAWLRLFSTYGPDDDPSWLIPYLTRALLRGERPSLTRAEQIWDYLHVDDAAAAVVAAIDSNACGVFNLGSGRAIPLAHIIGTLRDSIDPALPLGLGDVPYRPDQVMHLEADISALVAATGWRPRVSLEAGLREVIEWHRTHPS